LIRGFGWESDSEEQGESDKLENNGQRGMAAAASTIIANDMESIGKRRSTENSRNRDSS
jgi:hypothetical protein